MRQLTYAALAIAIGACTDRSPTAVVTVEGPNGPRFTYDPCDWAPYGSCTGFSSSQKNDAWNLGYDIWSDPYLPAVCERVGASLMNMADRGALYTRSSGGYVGNDYAVGRWVPGDVAYPWSETDTYYQGGEAWIAQDSPNFWSTVVHEASHAVFDPSNPGQLLTDANSSTPTSITAAQAAAQCY